MLQSNPLRATRGTGCEQNVRKIFRRRFYLTCLLAISRRPIAIKVYQFDATYCQFPTELVLSKEELQTRIFEDTSESLLGISRVKWNVGPAGFQNSQYSHQQIDGTIGTETYQNVGAYAFFDASERQVGQHAG